MPYFYEVDSILSQLYENNSINDFEFPDFRRVNMQNDRELAFFVSGIGLQTTTRTTKNTEFFKPCKFMTFYEIQSLSHEYNTRVIYTILYTVRLFSKVQAHSMSLIPLHGVDVAGLQ